MTSSPRSRRLLLAAATLPVAAALALPAAPAGAAVTRCPSADLRYPFQEGQPNFFGVHRLRIDAGSCRTAHRVAKRWMTRFENALSDGRVELPRRVEGFRFKALAPSAAQTYALRGRRDGTTIRFDYVVPNG